MLEIFDKFVLSKSFENKMFYIILIVFIFKIVKTLLVIEIKKHNTHL